MKFFIVKAEGNRVGGNLMISLSGLKELSSIQIIGSSIITASIIKINRIGICNSFLFKFLFFISLPPNILW